MKKLAIALLACSAFGAQAASSVGTLDNVVGNVSVGGQGFVAHAKNGMPLAEGSTVLVANKAKATVVLANGCTVSLLGSQHYTVDSKLSCEQSIASVKSLAATTRLAQAPLGTGTAGTAPVGAGGGAAAGGAGAAGGIAGFTAGAVGFGVFAVGLAVADSQVSKASGS